MSQTTGEKIKAFRKRAGMSQLDLELQINASPGSISRIEGDKVNPTKETLKDIAQALGLTSKEISDLFEISSLKPTTEEIDLAINEARDYLNNPNRYAYLLDEWGTLFAVSMGFVNALGLSEEQLKSIIGKNILEILIDPRFGVRKIIDPEYFEDILVLEVARFQAEFDLENTDLFQRLIVLPDFRRLFEESKNIDKHDIISVESKLAYLEINGQKIRFHFSREILKECSRFEIIEYFNPVPYE